MRGFVRESRKVIPPVSPVKGLRFFANGDSISFLYGEGTKSIYRYRFRCDELSGTARLFVTDKDTGVVREDTLRRSRPVKTF
jgi:hypothetical protein